MLKATSYPTTNKSEVTTHKAGTLQTHPTILASPSSPGQLNSSDATYVIETLQLAVDGCLTGVFDALVTPPVQKSVINDAGIPLSGHRALLARPTRLEQNLGLPIIRTSVDHGTALDLAGSGNANPNSLTRAIEVAIEMCGGS